MEPLRPKQKALVLAACILAAVLPWLLLTHPPAPAAPLSAQPDIFTYAGASDLVAGFFYFVGYAFLVYAGFQVSPWWGLANLVVPLAELVFLARYWRRCRDAALFLGLAALFSLVRLLHGA